jgi:hypothetical protein
MTRTPITSVREPEPESAAPPRRTADTGGTDLSEAGHRRLSHSHGLAGSGGAWRVHPADLDIRAGYTQGALALSFPMPNGLASVPEARALTVVEPLPQAPDGPTAESWAARFVQAVVEVLIGERPVTQLIRWTDEAVYTEIDQRVGVAQSRRLGEVGRPGRQKVATVHVCQVSPERAEIAARVTNGRRSRAVAARLDLHRGRWVCTAIHFG